MGGCPKSVGGAELAASEVGSGGLTNLDILLGMESDYGRLAEIARKLAEVSRYEGSVDVVETLNNLLEGESARVRLVRMRRKSRVKEPSTSP